MPIVTLRYWAAAKEAAGLAEERVDAGDVGAALEAGIAAAAARAPASAGRLRLVIARSSVLVDGEPVGTRAPRAVPVADGATIEILPPFAGG